jgi:uncharacterized membrane protein YkvA (DUF1232 family)
VSDTDPFPRDRFAATIRRMPRYAKLAWRLGRDPLLSRARRAAVVAAAGYIVSPIDAVPDVIPVLGRLDDIAVVLAALRFAMAGLDSQRRREHLDAVGLQDGDIAEDLRTLGVTTAWTLRMGGRTAARVMRQGVVIAGATAGAARDAAPVARQAAGTARTVAVRGASAASAAGRSARTAAAKGGGAIRAGAARLPAPGLPRRRRDGDPDGDAGSGI